MPSVIRSVGVFCSSSDRIAPAFLQMAAELGQALAEREWTLVFGGCNIGLMGVLAKSVHRFGGRVVGVIPEGLRDRGLAYVPADELVVVPGLRERKALMEARADAFLALPGGIGTLDEMLEVMAQKMLRAHAKPAVFVNPRGYYEPLLTMLEQMAEQNFAAPGFRNLYHVAPDVARALDWLENHPTSQNTAS
ncbi:MAG: TIGR00730 family Rossman fold protein [Terriglobales bacterium]